MAAAGPSSSAPSRPGAGVATMAAGRRGRGYGEVVATGTARPQCGGGALHGDDGAAVGLSAAPAMGDGVARSGCPRRAWSTPAPLRRRRVAGDGLLRHGLVGDDGIGSAAARVRSAAAPVRLYGADCRGPGRGQPTCCGFVGVGDDASISLPPVPPDPLFFFRCSPAVRRPLCSSLLRLGYFQSMLGSSLVR
uniref:Uncharacterized protein n=1 Tax=Oryza rufipogon TaxID=4529 RepID=A0A0E0QGT8_ORYRU